MLDYTDNVDNQTSELQKHITFFNNCKEILKDTPTSLKELEYQHAVKLLTESPLVCTHTQCKKLHKELQEL